jgi:hypothetical protein
MTQPLPASSLLFLAHTGQDLSKRSKRIIIASAFTYPCFFYFAVVAPAAAKAMASEAMNACRVADGEHLQFILIYWPL